MEQEPKQAVPVAQKFNAPNKRKVFAQILKTSLHN
jgi:hypothetical protein